MNIHWPDTWPWHRLYSYTHNIEIQHYEGHYCAATHELPQRIFPITEVSDKQSTLQCHEII